MMLLLQPCIASFLSVLKVVGRAVWFLMTNVLRQYPAE